MLIVAGYLVVDPLQRDSYLEGCRAVVRQARSRRAVSTSRSVPT